MAVIAKEIPFLPRIMSKKYPEIKELWHQLPALYFSAQVIWSGILSANYAQKSTVTASAKTAFGLELEAQEDVIPAQSQIERHYQQGKIITKLCTLLFDSNVCDMDLCSRFHVIPGKRRV
jgi:hypothetical protein